MGVLVEAKNLYVGYKGEPIIKNANFKIYTKDFVFLTGVSGSGKTTIIKSLYGEVPVFNGSLNVGGIELNNIKKSKLSYLRKYLGVVFQDYKLIPEWTILKNVMLPMLIAGIDKKTAEEEAIKLLNKVKLSHKLDKYPAELSGGEQQRAAIARAIIHDPVMILADEPISGLDEYSANLVMELFIMANREKDITIMIASHSLPQTFDINYRQIHLEKGTLYELS
ncbi:ABC transporter ATP-binding protein [Nautilia sp. PV-1]|uniref:cell division ATP-binding protein FtsE n=1 Tax=Nautilia sp. PV-1 TaxID=2579250 RepID=UPI000FDB8207|nr:ABC transporter ATP-binding protein [Nautilia sp. PV-1]AZV46222.1 ABC transporter ATP-binding protein [Nautilia sp. PV-1]